MKGLKITALIEFAFANTFKCCSDGNSSPPGQTWAKSQPQQQIPVLLLRIQIPRRSNVGQSLMYRRHLAWLRKKLTSRFALLRRLAGSGLGRCSKNAANNHPWPGPFNSRVLCSCLVPQCSYIRLNDPAINDALRFVTGCLCPPPTDNFPILAGIQSTGLRCNGAALPLAHRSMEPSHLFQSGLTPSNRHAHALCLV